MIAQEETSFRPTIVATRPLLTWQLVEKLLDQREREVRDEVEWEWLMRWQGRA